MLLAVILCQVPPMASVPALAAPVVRYEADVRTTYHAGFKAATKARVPLVVGVGAAAHAGARLIAGSKPKAVLALIPIHEELTPGVWVFIPDAKGELRHTAPGAAPPQAPAVALSPFPAAGAAPTPAATPLPVFVPPVQPLRATGRFVTRLVKKCFGDHCEMVPEQVWVAD